MAMTIQHAKELIGKHLKVTFTDRLGNEQVIEGHLIEVEFVPMYGTKLTFDSVEILMERVISFFDKSLKPAA